MKLEIGDLVVVSPARLEFNSSHQIDEGTELFGIILNQLPEQPHLNHIMLVNGRVHGKTEWTYHKGWLTAVVKRFGLLFEDDA